MYLLVDVGGTHTRLGISRDGKTLEEFQMVPSEQLFKEAAKLFLLYKQKHRIEFKAAIIGLPGRLDHNKQKLLHANLTESEWVGRNIKQELTEVLHLPVNLENDAALGGLGEAVYGAGHGFPIVGFLTISTGIGGAKIVEGKLDANSEGFEPGFQIVGAKMLKEYVSGRALAKKYGKPAEEITDIAIWDEVAKYLSFGVNNIFELWSPDVIVLGGGLMNSIEISKVEQHLQQFRPEHTNFPPIKKAKLGHQCGLYGGIVYLNNGN